MLTAQAALRFEAWDSDVGMISDDFLGQVICTPDEAHRGCLHAGPSMMGPSRLMMMMSL